MVQFSAGIVKNKIYHDEKENIHAKQQEQDRCIINFLGSGRDRFNWFRILHTFF
jgi:hypothetical protein